jgi:hypothetical protein
LILTLSCLCSTAQDEKEKKKPPRRFGFDVDEITFPQQKPEDAMQSIAKAVDRKKIDYLLAHMVDPLHVDYWVDRYKESFTQGSDEGKRLLAFDRLVRERTDYLQNDPLIARDLRIFAREAKWEVTEDLAIGTTEKVPARKVFLRKLGERWFLDNKQQ